MRTTTKKVILTILSLLMACSVIAAGEGRDRFRIEFGETDDFNMGRAGVAFTSSQYNGIVRLKRGNQNNAPGAERPEFTQRLIDIRLYKLDDESVKHIVGPVYVYFNVRQAEARMWENGELTIYFFDTWKQAWTKCYTTPVYKGGRIDRLSCRMRVFGLYGLGLN